MAALNITSAYVRNCTDGYNPGAAQIAVFGRLNAMTALVINTTDFKKSHNVAVAALPNKLTRIRFKVLASEDYNPNNAAKALPT